MRSGGCILNRCRKNSGDDSDFDTDSLYGFLLLCIILWKGFSPGTAGFFQKDRVMQFLREGFEVILQDKENLL